MDGRDRIVIATECKSLSALAVDRLQDIVFWASSKGIEYADINGKNR